MDKINFRNLLIDLYNIYNQANAIYIDEMVEKCSRFEVEAVRNIFAKYNHKNSSYYNPEFNTDEYALELINEYQNGNRTFQNFAPKKQKETIQIESIKAEISKIETIQKESKQEAKEEIKEEVREVVSKNLQEVESLFAEKETELKIKIENLHKELEDKISKIKREETDEVDIRIFSSHSNSELDLPNKKIIAGMGKGSRLVIKDKGGKTIGLEITDIIYDGVSNFNEKPMIEIYLDKA